MPSLNLSLRQRADWLAHVWKSATQDHHTELEPLVRAHLPEDGVAIDVGAHAGQFTRMFARLAPRGRVVSFEPSPYALSVLDKALSFRGVRNVSVEPYGLGAEPGEVALATPLKRSGAVGYGLAHVATAEEAAAGQRRDVIRIDTLDAYVARSGLSRMDFVKVDVEGFEGPFLDGAAHSLARFRPALLIELDATRLVRAGDTPQTCVARLEGLGYRGERLTASGGLAPIGDIAAAGDFLFVAG